MRHVCAKTQASPPNTGVARSSGQRNALSVCRQERFYTLAEAANFITWRIWRTPFAMGPALCSFLSWNIKIAMKQKHTCSTVRCNGSQYFSGGESLNSKTKITDHLMPQIRGETTNYMAQNNYFYIVYINYPSFSKPLVLCRVTGMRDGQSITVVCILYLEIACTRLLPFLPEYSNKPKLFANQVGLS